MQNDEHSDKTLITRSVATRLGRIQLTVNGRSPSETKVLYMLCNASIERALIHLIEDDEDELPAGALSGSPIA